MVKVSEKEIRAYEKALRILKRIDELIPKIGLKGATVLFVWGIIVRLFFMK